MHACLLDLCLKRIDLAFGRQAREQMMVTTEYKTKLVRLRELQATVREGSATAERMRQEEEELAAKHSAEMERINHKYGGSLRSAKRKRASTGNDKMRKKATKKSAPMNSMGLLPAGMHATPLNLPLLSRQGRDMAARQRF